MIFQNNPYITEDGKPRILPSFVCYVDILGYSQLSKESICSGNGLNFLTQLRDALSNAYNHLRKSSKVCDGMLPSYLLKVFTDNIVLAVPLARPTFDYGEFELGDILGVFSEYQVGLATNDRGDAGK